MRTLFSFFCIISVAPCWAQLPDDVMPLSEVRVGTQGHVLSTLYNDSPTRLSMSVVSIDHSFGVYPKILIRVDVEQYLSGRAAQPILNGMSGSPAYIDGRFIGALASTKEGLLYGHAWVTPIEYALKYMPQTREAELGVLRDAPIPDVFEPGDAFVACSTWGDDIENCLGATVTYKLGSNRWYVQGHSSRPFNTTGIPHGHVAVPVWQASSRGLILSREKSSLSMERVGEPVGMLVWDNEFGGVLLTDHLPRTVPVRVFMGDGESPVTSFRVGHMSVASGLITGNLSRIGNRLFGINECAWIDVSIDIQGMEAPIVLRDVEHNFERPKNHGGFSGLLNWLFIMVRPRPVVEGIDIRYSRANTCDILTPKAAFTAVHPNRGPSLRVRFQRSRDFRTMVELFPAPTAALLPGAPLFVYDGVDIQNFLLAQVPFEQAIAMLNEHPNRAALYIVAVHEETASQPVDGDGIPDGWQVLTRQLSVVRELDLHGLPAMTPDQGIQIRGRFR